MTKDQLPIFTSEQRRQKSLFALICTAHCKVYFHHCTVSETGLIVVSQDGETELGTPEVDTSSHFCNTRSRCIKQNPELGTPELGTPELDTSLQFQK